jgi:hypothetical protein
MNERKAVTRETRGEYRKAGKKEKGLILDQYVRLTGYNRKYAIRILSSPPPKTAVASGWLWLYGLLNKVHTWTLEALKTTYVSSPFNIVEFHSDNGSQFINRDTINWWKTVKTLGLSHSRSYHKNDNCLRTSGPSRTEK